jgi:sugar phosphate isomerase/epimerase
LSDIRLTLDTNHAGLVDGLAESVQVIGPYVNHIHFSSNKGTKSDHCEPQAGVIDFYTVAGFLRSFEGLLIIELNECGDESAGALLRTQDYLVKLLNS